MPLLEELSSIYYTGYSFKLNHREPRPLVKLSLMSNKAQHQKELISRLRRVEGQLRGVQRLIEEDADCEKVAQQLAAARKALDRSFYEMLACALQEQLGATDQNAEAQQRVQTIAAMLAKYG